ncbi:MAG TPA: adenylyltransferase/cytidyltransferase family protein [Myxococcales bacterium]|nr:adenylyltransferase/cytidyltransferase family protein [Myxococcales bacterium]
MGTSSKIVSLGEATRRAAEIRATGGKVALANGVFDVLHVGHVRYLEAARRLADLLAVAVNSDLSVQANRGPGLPLVPEAERAEIVAALAAVDLVVVFGERDVAEVVRALRPELHVKGTDYREDTVPERALVESLGGRVVIAGDPKDHSSTALRARIKGG